MGLAGFNLRRRLVAEQAAEEAAAQAAAEPVDDQLPEPAEQDAAPAAAEPAETKRRGRPPKAG